MPETCECGSIKELFQSMSPKSVSVVQGKVISEDPLEIQVANDDKLVLQKNNLCIPRHLSDYKTTVDIALSSGAIDSVTKDGQGTHPHGFSGSHVQQAGDGGHTHPDSEGSHVHNVDTFNITGAEMTVYNALKTGDIVYMLSFNFGKKYYILDREA